MVSFRPLRVPTLMAVPMFAVLVSLGVWQLQRLEWKEALIERVDMRLREPPLDLGAALAGGLAAAEWHRVRVSGEFLHDREVYLFSPGPQNRTGLHVITPLVRRGGGVILVDRGFIPESAKDPGTRQEGQVAGVATVTGVLRLSQPPGFFTPAPDETDRMWFIKDAESMGAAMGLTLEQPVLLEADATPNPGGLPAGGQTRVEFPNNHLNYAITWFTLALALLVVYFAYHQSRGRLSFSTRKR